MEEIDKNDTSEEKITEHEHEGFEEERNQPVEHEERKGQIVSFCCVLGFSDHFGFCYNYF